jgi:hypothetical protein
MVGHEHSLPLVCLGVALVGAAALWIGAAQRRRWRDPVRFFTWPQKRQLIQQAGGRCEHKSPLWRRCPAPGTEADHVVPWSRGGPTQVRNGQLLCRRHNQQKSAWAPDALYRWRLRRRRRKYR